MVVLTAQCVCIATRTVLSSASNRLIYHHITLVQGVDTWSKQYISSYIIQNLFCACAFCLVSPAVFSDQGEFCLEHFGVGSGDYLGTLDLSVLFKWMNSWLFLVQCWVPVSNSGYLSRNRCLSILCIQFVGSYSGQQNDMGNRKESWRIPHLKPFEWTAAWWA